MLANSRTALHIYGEYLFQVPALALPDPQLLLQLVTFAEYPAITLFITRVQAARPDFALTAENAPAIAEICARLDGLPLALELAAARIRLLSLPMLLARLEHRLALLTTGAQDMPERQQTLRSTLGWSYHLLSDAE